MKFDEHWRVDWSPKAFFALAQSYPRRLINQYLFQTTPRAFPSFDDHYEFLEHIADCFNVPPRTIILRGSCQIGFSIKPNNDKLWQVYHDSSDLDLAVVDADLYDNTERKLRRWERTSRVGEVQASGRDAGRFENRQQDRYYHCCRLHDLPNHLSGHYRDAIKEIADLKYSGPWRPLKIFLYRDWWALRSRYESDLRQLCKGVADGNLIEPGDTALPRLRPPTEPSGRPSRPIQGER
jgi:hypothetical protein